jgi:hypothetical protein
VAERREERAHLAEVVQGAEEALELEERQGASEGVVDEFL